MDETDKKAGFGAPDTYSSDPDDYPACSYQKPA